MEQASTRRPNPKRFATLLAVVALFGGPCALQDVTTRAQTPPREELSAALEKLNPAVSQLAPEQREEMLTAALAFNERQVQVHKRFADYRQGFGVLLVIGYFILFTFALRAVQNAPYAARPLSIIALLMMPARVASAAVELAAARALQEPMVQFGAKLASISPGAEAPADQLAAFGTTMGGFFGWAFVALQAGWALALLVVFSQAWRYFGRPDVVALYRPEGDDGDDDEPL